MIGEENELTYEHCCRYDFYDKFREFGWQRRRKRAFNVTFNVNLPIKTDLKGLKGRTIAFGVDKVF